MADPEIGYWQRVEEVFHQALDLPAATRTSFIREHCAGDAAMEREVWGILSGYEAQDRISGEHATGSLDGARFGAFEIVSKIGEGGMGTVYLARRHADFEQRAAIKLIHGTPGAAALMAERFRQERQILAGLEHPNIARLLDGGVTSAGQPYLVMEYVEGVRLDEYCESHGLSISRRLELFRRICAAVHFAHQRLVIHRDLKPGNILVDEQGEPKLLDFGIARVLDTAGSSTQQTLTMGGSLLLTPEYASPEQIQGLPCTVASDVYSLGVILYQSLTGMGPYSATASTPAELIAAVLTKEVQRPSVVAPRNLKAALRGDLDGIAMKALARKPEERYGSVEQLSEDVRRHLNGLPVAAVEGRRLYVARKFVGRHRTAVTAAALVLFSLIAGLAGTLWQARAADRQRVLAEQRFSDARKLANYLLFPLFDAVQPLAGSLPVRGDMAGQSLQYLDRLSTAKSNDPALRKELAGGYLRLATIAQAPSGYGDSLGNPGLAIESAQKSLALLEPLSKEERGNEHIQHDLALGYLVLGDALELRGKSQEGIATLTRATAMYDHLLASKPNDADRLVDAGRAWQTLMDRTASPGGGFFDTAAKYEVLAAGSKAISRFDAALAISPSENRAWFGIEAVYQTESGVESPVDPREGLATIRMGLDAFHRLPASEQSSPAGLGEEARLEASEAWAQQRMGQYKEALAALERPREITDRFAAADPGNSSKVGGRAALYVTLANIHVALKQNSEAIADYLTAIRTYDGLVAIDPSKTSSRMVRAVCEAYVARLLAEKGRASEEETFARAGIQDLENLADRPNATAQYLDEASIALMVTPVLSLRDYPRALRYAKRADEMSHGKEIVAITYLTMTRTSVTGRRLWRRCSAAWPCCLFRRRARNHPHFARTWRAGSAISEF